MEPYPLSSLKGALYNKGDLCCMNDGAKFEGLIYSYPLRQEQGYWTVRGVFCSLSCAKQYLIDRRMRGDFMSLLHLMALEVFGISRIVTPGTPEILKRYCGPGGWSIKAYRAFVTRCELLDPQIMLPIQMQEETMYQIQLQPETVAAASSSEKRTAPEVPQSPPPKRRYKKRKTAD